MMFSGGALLPSHEEVERAKYEKMAEQPHYRDGSIGLNYTKLALQYLDIEDGETLLDFGCGTGRCLMWFREREIDCRGLDITDKRLQDGARPYFTQACLWDFETEPADWGFCTDVLEHIPPVMVMAVLNHIFAHTRKGVFFSISCQPDTSGRKVGEVLHLTVRPPETWKRLLGNFWSVKVIESNPNGLVCVCHA